MPENKQKVHSLSSDFSFCFHSCPGICMEFDLKSNGRPIIIPFAVGLFFGSNYGKLDGMSTSLFFFFFFPQCIHLLYCPTIVS